MLQRWVNSSQDHRPSLVGVRTLAWVVVLAFVSLASASEVAPPAGAAGANAPAQTPDAGSAPLAVTFGSPTTDSAKTAASADSSGTVSCPQRNGVSAVPSEAQTAAAATLSRQTLILCDIRYGTNLLSTLDRYYARHPERWPTEFLACSDIGTRLGAVCAGDPPPGNRLAFSWGGYCFDGTKFAKVSGGEDCGPVVVRAKLAAVIAKPESIGVGSSTGFCTRDTDCGGAGACYLERNLFTSVVSGRCFPTPTTPGGAAPGAHREDGRACLLDSECASSRCDSGICHTDPVISHLACASPGERCSDELTGVRSGDSLEKILASLHGLTVDRHESCCPGAVCAQRECVLAPSTALIAARATGLVSSVHLRQSCRTDLECDIEHGQLCLANQCRATAREALEAALAAGPAEVSFSGGRAPAPGSSPPGARSSAPRPVALPGPPSAVAPPAPEPEIPVQEGDPSGASADNVVFPKPEPPIAVAVVPVPVPETPSARRPATDTLAMVRTTPSAPAKPFAPAPPPAPPGPSKIQCQAGYAVMVDPEDLATKEEAEEAVARAREAGWLSAESHEASMVGCEYIYDAHESRRVYRVGALNAAEIVRRYRELGAHEGQVSLHRELKERGLVAH